MKIYFRISEPKGLHEVQMRRSSVAAIVDASRPQLQLSHKKCKHFCGIRFVRFCMDMTEASIERRWRSWLRL